VRQRNEAVTRGGLVGACLRRRAAPRAPSRSPSRADAGAPWLRWRVWHDAAAIRSECEGRRGVFPGCVASVPQSGAEAVLMSSRTFSLRTGVLFYGTYGDAHPPSFVPAHRRSPAAQVAGSDPSSQRAGCPASRVARMRARRLLCFTSLALLSAPPDPGFLETLVDPSDIIHLFCSRFSAFHTLHERNN